MRRVVIIIIILLVLAAGGLFAANRMGYLSLNRGGEAAIGAPADQATATPIPPVIATDRIVAEARVVPVQRAGISAQVSGIVAEVLVQEGDQVEEEQVLLRLDQAQARAAVGKAEADLMRAQANLKAKTDGPRQQDLDAAQALVDAAQARLERLRQSTDAGDVAAAQASVANASANLQRVLDGATEQELIAAKADIANSRATLQQAQRAYDQVKWRDDIGALPQSAQLQQATNNFEAAQARYDNLVNGPRPAEINAANAQVSQANAQLEALKASRPSDLAALQADVRNAEAQLAKLKAGSTDADIAAAQADVMAATASLQQQLIALGQTEIRAPFAGTVAALNINPGEQASPGTALIQLAGTNAWQVETEDLTELQVVGLQTGAVAQITFDAIPDLELEGRVKSIRTFGENSSGDIVYRVVVVPTTQDPRLLWNMTAVVTFTTGQ
ncbi:MAG: HlyD family efflux transporter periplasmic adaptor subunit [Caldilineaceae bacterium]